MEKREQNWLGDKLFRRRILARRMSRQPGRDGKSLSVPSKGSRILLPPDDGEPTYYSYTTTISNSGGLPGWDKPDQYNERTFQEEEEWQLTSGGYWKISNNFSDVEQEFGNFQEPARLDVTTSVKSKTSYRATSRLGAQISQSARPPIDRIQQGSGPSMSRMPSAPSMAPIAFAAQASANNRPFSAAPVFSDAEHRASRADKVVITARGKGRELALLLKQFGGAAKIVGRVHEFRKQVGTNEVRVFFDSQLGGVTATETYENGRRVSETVHTYEPQDGLSVLSSISTNTFDQNGRKLSTFTQRIGGIEIR